MLLESAQILACPLCFNQAVFASQIKVHGSKSDDVASSGHFGSSAMIVDIMLILRFTSAMTRPEQSLTTLHVQDRICFIFSSLDGSKATMLNLFKAFWSDDGKASGIVHG